MRPQQQNRRMRGRGNNNRKGPNPLTRSYESNGPDVKVRGTAQQIADKYSTLARDAQSSSDRVMTENYLQHAEHYNRIIAAAQAQQQQQQQQNNNRDDRDDRDDSDDDSDERGEFNSPANQNGHNNRDNDQPRQQNGQSGRNDSGRNDHAARNGRDDQNGRDNWNGRDDNAQKKIDDGSGPQPVINGTPAEVAFDDQETRRKPANSRRRPRADKQVDRPEGEANGQQAAKADDAANGAGAANGSSSTGGADAVEAAAKRPRRTRRPRSSEDTGEDSSAKPTQDDRPEPSPAQG